MPQVLLFASLVAVVAVIITTDDDDDDPLSPPFVGQSHKNKHDDAKESTKDVTHQGRQTLESDEPYL